MEDSMFAVTGITGKVGGTVADSLLKAGLPVRAVVRDWAKGAPWAARGAEVAIADFSNASALIDAFAGTDGVFLMTPPNFDPEPGFPETQANAAALKAAIATGRPGKVVFLSTVAAPVAFLRAAWFMENASWDVEAARNGIVRSFLQPLDHVIPMVATTDIGRTAAGLLLETWTGARVVELEGPCRYSAADIGKAFAAALGRDVRMEPVPRDTWEAIFRSQGMKHPMPRIRMVDGFNEGWIDFERTGEHRIGEVTLETVIAR